MSDVEDLVTAKRAGIVRRIESVMSTWGHIVEEGTDWTEALNREYWSYVVDKFRPGDSVVIHSFDHRIQFTMLVLDCNTSSDPVYLDVAFLPVYPTDAKGKASRDTSGEVLNILAKNVPWLIGGSADLYPSTKTRLTFKEAGDFEADNYAGRNFHFGIREHAMGAILNGLSLSKIRPYGSTFLIFCDYLRPALRLSSRTGSYPMRSISSSTSFTACESSPATPIARRSGEPAGRRASSRSW